MPTAVLIDGGFFLKRYRKIVKPAFHHDPATVTRDLFSWSLRHLDDKDNGRRGLYRIFFYDCPPLTNKAHNPVSHRAIDFAKTPEAKFRSDLHAQLKKQRKVALRMGRLSKHASWVIRPEITKELLAGHISLADLTPEDVTYDTRQKGVDMRIGVDIASLAFKKQVDQIILVAGDSDFVPAAKLARREGVDFILDPMWQAVPEDLHEHIDGLRSTCPNPNQTANETAERAMTISP